MAEQECVGFIDMDCFYVAVERTLDKLGMRCSDTAQIFFDDVVVPRSQVARQHADAAADFEDARCVRQPPRRRCMHAHDHAHDCSMLP